MQFVSIFFPLWDAYKNKTSKSSLTGDNAVDQTRHGIAPLTPGVKARDIYSMASLEMQINKNLDPLLRWAAEKEFTAENIVFLRAVRDFKRKWTNVNKRSPALSQEQERERYEDAAYIWFKLVNPLTARFNINIDYRTYSELEQMFSGLRYEPYDDDESSSNKSSSRSDNVVAPWLDAEKDSQPRPPSPTSSTSPTYISDEKSYSDVDKLYPIPITEITVRGQELSDGAENCYQIPAHFTLEVFDKAFETVKNDVFLNTWVRYEARFSRPHNGVADLPLRQSLCVKIANAKPPSILKKAANRLFRRGN
jgi:hypothetical protein